MGPITKMGVLPVTETTVSVSEPLTNTWFNVPATHMLIFILSVSARVLFEGAFSLWVSFKKSGVEKATAAVLFFQNSTKVFSKNSDLFAKFTRKQRQWSSFLVNLQAWMFISKGLHCMLFCEFWEFFKNVCF